MTFREIKNEYERQREQERVSLAAYLAAHGEIKAAGLQVVTASGAGKGSEHYTACGRIPAYDLRNWKWVEVKGTGGFDAVVSLNMPDIDPRTQNIHSLYDRIGIIFFPEEWVYTAIDLPLEDCEKEQIAQLILKRFRASSLSA